VADNTVVGLISEFSKVHKDDFEVDGTSPPRIPSGIFALDLRTGGGIPEGRISILYGSEGSMKSTLALKYIARAQKMYPDKMAVFLDIEGHYDKSWAEIQGVDTSPERLKVLATNNAEQTVDLVEALLSTDDLSLLVVDSLAAMVTVREIDSEAEKAQVGSTGLMINKLYRKSGLALSKAKRAGRNPTVIMINQIRYKVGVMFGDPETMPGGPSFKYASSLTLRLSGKDIIAKDIHDNLPAFREINCVIKKTKVPTTGKKCSFQVALIDNPPLGIKVGESSDLPEVFRLMRQYDMFEKVGTKAEVQVIHPETGEVLTFENQKALKESMVSDEDFFDAIKAAAIDRVRTSV